MKGKLKKLVLCNVVLLGFSVSQCLCEKFRDQELLIPVETKVLKWSQKVPIWPPKYQISDSDAAEKRKNTAVSNQHSACMSLILSGRFLILTDHNSEFKWKMSWQCTFESLFACFQVFFYILWKLWLRVLGKSKNGPKNVLILPQRPEFLFCV